MRRTDRMWGVLFSVTTIMRLIARIKLFADFHWLSHRWLADNVKYLINPAPISHNTLRVTSLSRGTFDIENCRQPKYPNVFILLVHIRNSFRAADVSSMDLFNIDKCRTTTFYESCFSLLERVGFCTRLLSFSWQQWKGALYCVAAIVFPRPGGQSEAV